MTTPDELQEATREIGEKTETVSALVEAASERHLYATNNGAPWARATSVEGAMERVRKSEFCNDLGTMEQIPDDQLFTLSFEDPPEEFEADCAHTLNEFDECSEDCGEDRTSVTRTAGEWAQSDKYTNGVFGNFQA